MPVTLDIDEVESALEVTDIAGELVALWKEQKIAGLPRAERNAAIDGVRQRLVKAVEVWEAAKRRSDKR